jgi:molecular chaperone GrpE (heat shock protein)
MENEIESKLLVMIQENEKLVELVNELQSENGCLKGSYQKLQEHFKNYQNEMREEMQAKESMD